MFKHRRSRFIDHAADTTSQDSVSHKSGESEADNYGLFKTFGKIDPKENVNRKLTRGLYLRKGYFSEIENSEDRGKKT